MNATRKLKIGDLAIGDQVAVSWYSGQSPVVGIVSYVVQNASRASGTHIRLPSGQQMRVKSTCTITRAHEET